MTKFLGVLLIILLSEFMGFCIGYNIGCEMGALNKSITDIFHIRHGE